MYAQRRLDNYHSSEGTTGRIEIIENPSETTFIRGNKISIRNLSESEKAWLASAIDGEGSIILHNYISSATHKKGVQGVTIEIFNTSLDFLKYAQKIAGGKITVRRPPRRPNIPYKRTQYVWMLSRQAQAKSILEQIMPYLIIKREQAIKCLDWLNKREERRELFSKRMSELRQKNWKEPQYRRKISEGVKRQWQNSRNKMLKILYKNGLGKPWTDNETDTLREIYTMKTKEEIMRALPNRSWRAIRAKALRLGLKRSPDLIYD